MKVLVATKQTQGRRPDDFSYTLAGELVRWPPVVCDCDDCGCARAMEGLASHRGTTTFTVAERADLDPDDYRRLMVSHLLDGGWITGGPDNEENDWARPFIELHIVAAGEFDVGEILEIRNGQIDVRTSSSTGRGGSSR